MSKLLVVAGKRKTAVAKVRIKEGTGHLLYNGVPYAHLSVMHKAAFSEPLMIAEEVLGHVKADMTITAAGGGKEGQIQAARLGLAKALVAFTKSLDLRKAYIKYDRNLLVADIRRKETYKPGDSKARAKRQKSYR
jgi:small subunit ribosomal protein S9